MYLVGYMIVAVAWILTALGHTRAVTQFRQDEPIELVKPAFVDVLERDFGLGRSANKRFEFPELLVANVTTDGVNVTLTLTYSHVNGPNIPAYVIKDGNLVKINVVRETRHAFYQDMNTGASLLVACTSTAVQECSLDGTFYNRERRMLIRPHESFSTTRLHEMQRDNQTELPFDEDAIEHVMERLKELKKNNIDDMPSFSTRTNRALPEGVNILEVEAYPDYKLTQTYVFFTWPE